MSLPVGAVGALLHLLRRLLDFSWLRVRRGSLLMLSSIRDGGATWPRRAPVVSETLEKQLSLLLSVLLVITIMMERLTGNGEAGFRGMRGGCHEDRAEQRRQACHCS